MFNTTVKSGFPTILDKIEQWEETDDNNDTTLYTAYADITNGSLKEFYDYIYNCFLNGGLSICSYKYDNNNNPIMNIMNNVTNLAYADIPNNSQIMLRLVSSNVPTSMTIKQHNGKDYVVAFPEQK